MSAPQRRGRTSRAAAAPPVPQRAAVDVEIPRRELLDRMLQHAATQLLVVQGPAGYGKTVLLRQYCASRGERGDAVAWVRVEPGTTDAAQFLHMLCDAARSLTGRAERKTRGREAPAPSIRDFADIVARVRKPAVLVVDNFEQGANVEFGRVLSQVIRLLPPSLQLCIGTRVMPVTRLARMRVQEESFLLDEADLRFQPAETHEFFRDTGNLPGEEIDKLHQRTDGWPAALQCFRLCIQRGRVQRSAAYAGEGVTPELIDFLATDVFEALEPDQQHFLLQACVPEKINRALVERITGVVDGDQRIREIERAGLFLTPIDLERNWYRFHNLFRQFLLARVRRQVSAESLRQQHQRIAEWFALAGYREEAIQHYIDAGDVDAAVTLLDGAIDRLVAEERLGLIERIVEQIPEEALLDYEHVFDAAVIAYGFRRRFDKANRLLAMRDAAQPDDGLDEHARGLRNYVRLFVLVAEDRVQELGEVAEATRAQLDERDGFKYAVTFNARALGLIADARFEEARDLLLQARPLHDQDRHLFGQAYQEALYSMVLSQQGRVTDAVRGLEAALRRTEAGASGSAAAGSAIAAYLAEGFYEQNRVSEAEALAHDYAQLAEQQAIVDAEAVMCQTLARIAFNRGDEGEAEELLDRAMYLGYRHKLDRIVRYARAELVRQATLKGDLATAEQRLDQLFPDGAAAPDDALLFHAGECEVHAITRARFLIAAERHREARALLNAELRRARAQRRQRRVLKLNLMLALALNADGEVNAARRALISALEIGGPGGFVRSFLDERQPAIRLLRETRQSLAHLPDLLERDVVSGHLDDLLIAAGESAPAESRARAAAGEDAFSPDLLEQLTERELYILQHVSRGLSNKGLAERLSVSVNTVKWHLRNIFEKLRISNRVQAVAVARHFGLID
ncbi:LuxR C-terminal-related transcriptional regulator [Algiphilus sp.]|uniref:LuxR C-terminal-related transcriptional regulator n=1 Tax=Algiphilus sp. TaxID=1872431 RepID=UPI0025BFBA16|nr:LuxR C-terminal-related transcriptional regulator [Algiphilus sp.]MCK5771179.1 hypothetical protein [Algiphilus sp.]